MKKDQEIDTSYRVHDISHAKIARESAIGSLRIDDFRTTAPLGHLIVPRRRPVEIEFTIRIKDDDVFARPANFLAVSEVCFYLLRRRVA